MLKGWTLTIAVGLMLLAGTAFAAGGNLFAVVDYSFADYQARVDGQEALSASHLAQKYTLGYRQDGRLYNGQAGAYSLLLGYEHTALDPELSIDGIDDPTVQSLTTDKLLYNAELLLAPGGLPFRLHLFAHDLSSSTFSENNLAAMQLPVGAQDHGGHLIDPGIYTDINNGSHQTFGGTLMVGIRNGSYLGLYRDVLSQFPRLLIDFKQTEVKDLHGQIDGGTHYRERDLAFVSLNKKDNWLHYRLHDYSDFVRPDQNEKRSQVILGSIDQSMQRQWINLTNWIQISADGSYTVTDESYRGSLLPERRYDLNAFALARRTNMDMSSLNRFMRQDDGTSIEQSLDVPLTYTGDLDRDTRLSLRFVGERSQRETRDAALNAVETSDNASLYLHTQGELHRTSNYLLIPKVDVEKKYGTTGIGQGLRLGLELASNRERRTDRQLVLGNNVTYISGTTSSEVSGDVVQDEIYGRWDQRLSPTLRAGVLAKVIYLNGLSDNSMTNYIHTTVDVPMTYSSSGATLVTGHRGWALRATETAYVEHNFRKLLNRLSLTSDVARDSTNASQFGIDHNLRYEPSNSLKLTIDNRYVQGGSSGFNSVGTQSQLPTQANAGGVGKQNYALSSRSRIDYTPTPALLVSGFGQVATTSTDNNSYAMGEEISYRLFTKSGAMRKWAELTEKVAYERITVDLSQERDGMLLCNLRGTYQPNLIAVFGAQLEYIVYHPTNATQTTYSADAGFHFSKLDLRLSYAYGTKQEESSLTPKVQEQRVGVDLRKIF